MGRRAAFQTRPGHEFATFGANVWLALAARTLLDLPRPGSSMSSSPIVPTDPQDENWDAIVIGTGMGGSTVGYGLARRGFKVLFLEKGHYLFGEHDRDAYDLAAPEAPDERLAGGWWPFRMRGRTNYGELNMFPSLGCGTGGSTSVYAAQLERFFPADMEPGKYHGKTPESTVQETWPITYDELVPHYREAERLFRVCGTPDPLNADPESPLAEPPTLGGRDQSFFDAVQSAGLHPYRAHVGCRYIPDCMQCGGRLCPKDCKSDAGRVCLEPAIHQHGARILPDCEVLALEADTERVTGVRFRRNGEEGTVRAKVVITAAGALHTPILLLRSKSDAWPDGLANRSGHVGRNLMMHAADLIAFRAPKPAKGLPAEGPAKAVTFNDFYVHEGVKLGTVESMGVPVSLGAVNTFLKTRAERDPAWYLKMGRVGRIPAAIIGSWWFKNAAVYSTIVEDLPYADNRVVVDDEAPGGMRFEYNYREELLERNVIMRNALRKRLPRSVKMMTLTGEFNLNYGHACGTCRAGSDPEQSVVDRTNRAHHLENLYVADASAFPTSGGTNPSLTIAANSLRVAGHIAEHLGAPAETPPTRLPLA